MPPRRPGAGRIALAVFYCLLALNAWAQVALVPLGYTDDPGPLTLLQALVGAAAAAAAWGSWRGRRWGPAAALLHGLVTAGMLLALVPLLDLGPEARGGLWGGAAGVLVSAIAAAWYLRRALRRSVAADSPAATR